MTNETEIIIGKVQSVDTGNISVKVDTEALLNSHQEIRGILTKVG
jgi:hypothetical protein